MARSIGIELYTPRSRRTKKRKPVSGGKKRKILEKQGGKCKKCRKSIKSMRVRPILHHKNNHSWDDRESNLMVVCPNCHDKIHQRMKKVRKKVTGDLGQTEYKVVKKTTRKKTRKKKKRKRVKRKKSPFEITFGF